MSLQALVDIFYDEELSTDQRMAAYERLRRGHRLWLDEGATESNNSEHHQMHKIWEDVTLYALRGDISTPTSRKRWTLEVREAVWHECDIDTWSERFERRILDTLVYDPSVTKDRVTMALARRLLSHQLQEISDDERDEQDEIDETKGGFSTAVCMAEACRDELQKNIMDSAITGVVSNLLDSIKNFITDDELADPKTQAFISELTKIFTDSSWTGTDFYCAPSRAGLASALSKLLDDWV